MSKAQRIKGQRWEQDVASIMRDLLEGARVVTGRQSGAYDDCPDVVAGPFALECKVGAKPPGPLAILAQAKSRAGTGIPVGVVKVDRQPPYVVMDLDDWETLVWQWWRRERP